MAHDVEAPRGPTPASAALAKGSGVVNPRWETACLLYGDADVRSHPASSIVAACRPPVGRSLERKTPDCVVTATIAGGNSDQSDDAPKIARCRTGRRYGLVGTFECSMSSGPFSR